MIIGKPVILIDFINWEFNDTHVYGFANKNFIKVAENPDSLIKLINELSKNKRLINMYSEELKENSKIFSYFNEKNPPTSRIIKLIQELIEKNKKII